MAAHSSEHASGNGHQEVGHIVPIRLTMAVGAFLLMMTALTVATAKGIDLGNVNIWLALTIALVKASAVCLYFMHLRWDSPFNAIVLISSLLFVMLMIGFTITDTGEYKNAVKDWRTSGNAPLVSQHKAE